MTMAIFFTADDLTHGIELWITDGTAAGTVLVKDINPGPGGSFPSNLTNVNGTLFFTAFDPINGTELWLSDGTAAGTVLVKDISLGISSSNPRQFTSVSVAADTTAPVLAIRAIVVDTT